MDKNRLNGYIMNLGVATRILLARTGSGHTRALQTLRFQIETRISGCYRKSGAWFCAQSQTLLTTSKQNTHLTRRLHVAPTTMCRCTNGAWANLPTKPMIYLTVMIRHSHSSCCVPPLVSGLFRVRKIILCARAKFVSGLFPVRKILCAECPYALQT